MVGRASAFADPEIIKMARNDFIPVSVDDWYQRRRQDKEGAFFRSIADAAGKNSKSGDSLQGIYCFAADGTLLAYKNAGQSADVTRQELREALFKFDQLPEKQRKPGAVMVEDRGRQDPSFARTPPEGGLILKSFTRILDYKANGYCKGTCSQKGADHASRDHVWLTADEVQSLAPAKTAVGFRYQMPKPIVQRLIRFHLVDNTRGEPVLWNREEIRSSRFTLTVVAQNAEEIELRLEGQALLANQAVIEKADHGYEVRVVGNLRYLPKKRTFDRFDMSAIGTHWGDSPHSLAARPGKTLLGVTFELAGDSPLEKVAPQGVRNREDYYGRQ